RGDRVARAARAIQKSARVVLQGARGVLHEVRDAVLPHAHRDPVRPARPEDLPIRRLSPMNLLGPVGGSTFLYVTLVTAGLAIGAYIIKMRRRRFEVPFSALWKRVLEQKDSNALWKQLKRLLSLLLILVILGLVLFAALDPTLGSVDREARNVVILIDARSEEHTSELQSQ